MTNVLILGAGGRIARRVTGLLADAPQVHLTLFARSAERLGEVPDGVRVIEGDALDREDLWNAVEGQDIVFAALVGEVEEMAEAIVTTMTAHEVRRLIFTAALGIYDEVPGEFGEWNRKMLGGAPDVYRAAAEQITGSGLDYTILRPAWLIDDDEVDYAVTHHGEEFRGTVVGRQSVAAAVAEIVKNPEQYSRDDIGLSKPGTENVRPYVAGQEDRDDPGNEA